jgi:hypothetical protein
VLGHAAFSSDKRQVDLGLRNRAQFFLGLLASFLETLEGHLILAKVKAVLLLELIGNVVDKCFIKIVATQVSIATG